MHIKGSGILRFTNTKPQDVLICVSTCPDPRDNNGGTKRHPRRMRQTRDTKEWRQDSVLIKPQILFLERQNIYCFRDGGERRSLLAYQQAGSGMWRLLSQGIGWLSLAAGQIAGHLWFLVIRSLTRNLLFLRWLCLGQYL